MMHCSAGGSIRRFFRHSAKSPWGGLALALPLLLALTAAADASTGYLRTPDIHGDTVVFCAEGDLWTVAAGGGLARRLTTHDGAETNPSFSPDGKWIAFSGQYDGNRDVFVMPAAGGEPRRLTWHPAPDEVIGWTPDGQRILFRSWRESAPTSWELFSVPAAGGDVQRLPLGWCSRLDIDPASGRYAFNRINRESRTWKRYRGGLAATIWVGDPKQEDYREVTTFTGTNGYPMWHGGRIVYLCDEGGTANLWSMQPDGSDRKQLTHEDVWDARWPSMGPDGRVVYMLAGGIKLFDPASGQSREIPIELPSERLLTRERYSDVARYVTGFSLSPDGDRLAVVARGEIFSVPAEDGVTLAVTRGNGAREEAAEFSPDGKRLLYLTDEGHEESFRTADAWGRGDVKVVVPAAERGYHYPAVWAPDGKHIAYGDDQQTLWVAPADGGKPVQADASDRAPITDYTWSPDGRWLAYTKRLDNDFASVFIYDSQDKETRRITSVYTEDQSPAWDPDGKYLYFSSSRAMNPVFGSRDFNVVEANNVKLYLTLLQADGENPFAHLEGMPPGAEDEKDKEKAKDKDKADKKDKDKKDDEDKDDDALEPVKIDFDGIGNRSVALDVPAGQYGGLGAVSGKLFYFSRPLQGWSEGQDEDGPGATLMAFDLESKEADTFMDGVAAYSLALKADKIAVAKGRGELYVVGTGSAPSDLGESRVSLDGIVIDLDPREEWSQIYYEAWRRMRDRYWDPNMAGADWKSLRDQYASLLPRLANRDDLRDLLGELIGELSTSHTYVWGGDYAVRPQSVATGLLGADLAREGDVYRVARIYYGDEADDLPSPLLAAGVNVKVGDVLLAVNGRGFAADRPFLASLENFADKDVLLTVAADAAGKKDRRDVVVHTLGSENALRYADWVRHNREWVDKQSGGKFGYLHIPDMGYDGMTTFDRWFYPQCDKEGMVVDCRWNGGGFVSQILLERFRRPVTAWDRNRWGRLDKYPQMSLNGPFVVLTNQFAGSDGDIFPRAVQIEKLAPVIGKRSWGGVIGINMARILVDGGVVTYPYSAWWDRMGGWSIENHGVDPDIEVENQPEDVAAGKDSQLERGLAELTRLHKENPPAKPDFEPIKSESRGAYKREG